MTANDTYETLRMELRRGSLVLAVLAALRSEKYGYTLRRSLSDRGLDIDEGTLYPLLRRLESQGMLESEWRDSEGRSKRFYRLSTEGRALLKQLHAEWKRIAACLGEIL
ncbi:MAG TPA: helix-turn-helix transcriptional regulator [Usitatibacter sp.]|nr:helix-turn-helix transcriptional regulator [Usitatibacter sp.]